jgi:DNA-directed RNA polymerase subunit RPC12/RpoP
MTSPLRIDIMLREAREGSALNAKHCDVCALHAEAYRCGYRMTELAPADRIAPKPVKMHAKYEGVCAQCGQEIGEGDSIWWTRGVQGVHCDRCGSAGR